MKREERNEEEDAVKKGLLEIMQKSRQEAWSEHNGQFEQ